MKKKVYIQGEVIVKQVEAMPKQLPEENKDGIAAYGETGNPHVFQSGKFKLYGDVMAAKKYLEVHETTELVHGHSDTSRGHESMTIEPGVYEIYPQNEIDVIERRVRAVMD